MTSTGGNLEVFMKNEPHGKIEISQKCVTC